MKNLLTIFLLLFGLGAMAQNEGQISGSLIDPDTKEPVPFANVYVEVGGSLIGAVTDEKGWFVIKPLQPGTYDVTFSAVGLGKKTVVGVPVKPEGIAWLKNTEFGSDAIEISGFEKVAYKNKMIDPMDPIVHIITAEQLKNTPSLKDPVKRLTMISPEISTGGTDDEIYFKGARSDASGYYVDGVKLTEGLGNVPGSAISSIRAYTGGLPAKYGDATGGVVVIETKSYFELYQNWKSSLN